MSDRGAASVLVLSFAAVLALCGATTAAVAAVGVARHRAAAVADLAALAAAQAALEGRDAACARAQALADADGARLLRCSLDGDTAAVVVEVVPPGRLGRLGSTTAAARAGPVRGAGAGTR